MLGIRVDGSLTMNIGSLKEAELHWLVWLSGLSVRLQTERLLVRFLVRAHAWVVGQVPSWGLARDNQ